MNDRDRIVVLLEHYLDVLSGMQEVSERRLEACPMPCRDWAKLCLPFGCAKADGGVLALMCEAWNHPSYRELERLLAHMQRSAPTAFWHVAETYIRPERRRVAWCPRCKRTAPSSAIGTTHRHGRIVDLEPKMERLVRADVDPRIVAAAIDWLARNWSGEVFIPDDLKGVAA